MSAALSSGSILFREKDSIYADWMLETSKKLFKFAVNYRGNYSHSIPDAARKYRSAGYYDDLCEAAALLYMATGEDEYL